MIDIIKEMKEEDSENENNFDENNDEEIGMLDNINNADELE